MESYVSEFKDIKNLFDKKEKRSGIEMECADLYRDYEWMLTDDADYAKNTYEDLLVQSDNCKEFKKFLDAVIDCMKYNLSQIED